MLDYLRIMLNARLAKMDERGASAVEYGLLVAGIAAVIVGIVFVLGGSLSGAFTQHQQLDHASQLTESARLTSIVAVGLVDARSTATASLGATMLVLSPHCCSACCSASRRPGSGPSRTSVAPPPSSTACWSPASPPSSSAPSSSSAKVSSSNLFTETCNSIGQNMGTAC